MVLKGIDKAIRDMKARSQEFRGGTVYDESGKILSGSIAKNVQSGGRPRWKKRKGNYSHPILDKTGLMRDSAEQSALRWTHNDTEHINRVTSTDYGFIHQYRGVRTRKGNTIEKVIRRFVELTAAEKKQIITLFQRAFLRK